MASEFVPFDEVAEELGMAADQLKKLISSGGIRAYSDGGTFKFRRKDLDKYKQRRQSEPTIVTPDNVDVVDVADVPAAAAPAAQSPAPVSAMEPFDDLVDLLGAPPDAP